MLINMMENILTAGAMDIVSCICVKLNQDVALKSIPKRSTSKIFDIFLMLNKAALFIEDTVKGCVCVFENVLRPKQFGVIIKHTPSLNC